MEKKEIYEHLAKIYLDASSKSKRKKKQVKKHADILKIAMLAALPALLAVFILQFALPAKKHPNKNAQLALVLQPEAVKLNFNFDPAKKEIYTIGLNNLNLSSFRALSFSARKKEHKNSISLKVEINSKFREKAAVYLTNIPNKWENYVISLSDFKGIANISNASSISFIIEEWNTKEKNSVAYIDNISLLK